MDFRLTEDQEALRDGVRSFCEGRVPVEALADLEKTGGFDASLWSELAELGVFALRLGEADGGVGLGTADAVVVFAELGRRLVPGPLVWSHLAAGAGLVPGAGTGEVVVGGLDCTAGESGPILVEHLESLHALLVLQRDGVFRVDPKTLDAQAVATPTDPLTPLHHVATLPAGDRVGDADDAARLRLEGAALTSGLLLGIAQETQALAVAYAMEREQFGRPIGSFQSIKHILADMYVRQQIARAAVYAAGATLDDPEVGDVARAISSAKLNAGEAAMKNARA
ncbi:MAG: acyl-CoA/acyl-ACP dehydrogenase, partial [Proteobacteria bacterium]|nr:acyl-CoA/acyl-ACP dehydrogenase [Pseudomonadota bacterium]